MGYVTDVVTTCWPDVCAASRVKLCLKLNTASLLLCSGFGTAQICKQNRSGLLSAQMMLKPVHHSSDCNMSKGSSLVPKGMQRGPMYGSVNEADHATLMNLTRKFATTAWHLIHCNTSVTYVSLFLSQLMSNTGALSLRLNIFMP